MRVTITKSDAPSIQNLISDAEGKFVAEVPTEPNDKTLGVLGVVAPGHAFAEFLWQTPDQTFSLSPGKTWGGFVLDENEKPMPDVRVVLRSVKVEATPRIYFGDEAPTIQTDAQSHWQFDNLPLQGEAAITISNGGANASAGLSP